MSLLTDGHASDRAKEILGRLAASLPQATVLLDAVEALFPVLVEAMLNDALFSPTRLDETLAAGLRLFAHSEQDLDSCSALLQTGEACTHPPHVIAVMQKPERTPLFCGQHGKSGSWSSGADWVDSYFLALPSVTAASFVLRVTRAGQKELALLEPNLVAFFGQFHDALLSSAPLPALPLLRVVPEEVKSSAADVAMAAANARLIAAANIERDQALQLAAQLEAELFVKNKALERAQAAAATATASATASAEAAHAASVARRNARSPFGPDGLLRAPSPLELHAPRALNESELEVIFAFVEKRMGWHHTGSQALIQFRCLPEAEQVKLLQDDPGVDKGMRLYVAGGSKSSSLAGGTSTVLSWVRALCDVTVTGTSDLHSELKKIARIVGPSDLLEAAARCGWDTLVHVLELLIDVLVAGHIAVVDATDSDEEMISKFSVLGAYFTAMLATVKDIKRTTGEECARRAVVMWFSHRFSMAISNARLLAEHIVFSATGTESKVCLRLPQGSVNQHALAMAPLSASDSPVQSLSSTTRVSPASRHVTVVQSLSADQVKVVTKILRLDQGGNPGGNPGGQPSAGATVRQVLQSEQWKKLATPIVSFFTEFAALGPAPAPAAVAALASKAKSIAAAWSSQSSGGERRERGGRGGGRSRNHAQ